jgi:hypothetical protein
MLVGDRQEVVLMLRCISAAGALSREKAADVKQQAALAEEEAAPKGSSLPPALASAEVGVVVDSASHPWFGGPQDPTGKEGSPPVNKKESMSHAVGKKMCPYGEKVSS